MGLANIVTGLDGLGTTLIPWVRKYKVGSIPTVTTTLGSIPSSLYLVERVIGHMRVRAPSTQQWTFSSVG